MLTQSQILHNELLDFEIKQAERENKRIQEHNQRQIEEWKRAGEPLCGLTGLILTSKKIVMGIRYIE